MKPEMKLATDAFLLEDIMLPKFYSVQFELYMDAPENDDEKYKLILGLTNSLKNTQAAGDRDPTFSIERIHNKLLFAIKVFSGTDKNHKTPITGEWFGKWLSFK